MVKNKKIILIFIIFIISILFLGCITVNAFIDTKDEGEKRIDEMKVAEENLSEKYENLLRKEDEVTYKYSSDDIKVYTDKGETEYLVKDEKLVGFIKELNPNETVIQKRSSGITERDAYEIAKTYCENNISNFEEYTFIENTFVESYKEYNVVFNKKIGEYQTMDLIFIAVNLKGEITAFAAPNQGKFDEFNFIDVDANEVSQYIKNELNNNYNNIIKFIEYDKTFKIIENKLTLECMVELIFKDGKIIADTVNYYI